MTTRLDRLFLLLDTGSTPLIRKSAAEQLGDVQKLHPYELNNLLTKVHGYLKSSSWETRIAAAHAVQAIARNVPQWEPRGAPKHEGASEAFLCDGKLVFSQFDLQKVLHNGSSLLGSEGEHFSLEEKLPELDERERLMYQKQMLNKRLGLNMAGNVKLGLEDIFTDEDLLTGMKGEHASSRQDSKAVADLVRQQLVKVGSGLSARERNRAKRKAKLLAKQKSRESPIPMESEAEPPVKKTKGAVSENGTDDKAVKTEMSFDLGDELDEWPFEWFCEQMMGDLFNSTWETRHGAATGLREVVKLHGRGAGKAMDIPADQMNASNQLWLSDLALRLLCVMALDRFGDFVSDEVVAPVRETCAQTLGVVMKYLEIAGIQGVLSILLQLLAQNQWEVRHGGLLGIKYLLAVRKDMTSDLLPAVLPFVFHGLQDIDDDVRAVAAAALVPVADNLVQVLPQQIPVIVLCLWETLLDLDDLTASTNSIMTLLSTLMAHPQASVLDWMSRPLTDLVPRLWPFLRHNISSVRKAALETLLTLVSVDCAQHPQSSWLPLVLVPILRHLYQRSLLEYQTDILEVVVKVWGKVLEKTPLEFLIAAATPWLGVWLSLAMQPAKIPYDTNYLIEAKHRGRVEPVGHRGRHLSDQQQQTSEKDHPQYIAGFETVNSSVQDRDICVTRARMTAANLLGLLSSYICKPVPNFPAEGEKPVDSLCKLLVFHLNTKSAVQRIVIAEVVYCWAQQQECQCTDAVKARLLDCLSEAVYFDEIAAGFTRMQTDCRDFIASLKQQGINMDAIIPPGSILSLEQAMMLVSSVYDEVKEVIKPKNLSTFQDRRSQLHACINQTTTDQQGLTIRVQTSLARAVVTLSTIPEKINPVIRPLMDCIKKEENHNLQREAARCLARLLQKCLKREPCPNGKVVKNLSGFLCCDPHTTPVISQPPAANPDTQNQESYNNVFKGNLTLSKLQKAPEVGRRYLKRVPSVTVNVEATAEEIEAQKHLAVQRRGGEVTLVTVSELFGESMPQDMPMLWEILMKPFDNSLVQKDSIRLLSESVAQEIVHSLQVLEVVGVALHSSLIPKVLEKFPYLLSYLQCNYTAVRHLSARCIGMLSTLATADIMAGTVEHVLPMLGATDDDIRRQGASETIANILERLNMAVIPYIVLLIVPVLGQMGDKNEDVRMMATHCFATLIRLLPLEAGVPDPPEMKAALVEQKVKERRFLEQLMDGSKLESYSIDVPIKAELRKYQQDGVNWLAFLNKYKLHGILCDDMGLGKTLQSICIIAGDHHKREQQYKSTKDPSCSPLPSIVVCPPTLIGHWVYEVKKFVETENLNPLMYAGPPAERVRLQKKAKKYNLIVASYDVVRNDIDFFGAINWNYCVLDEGHIIKNGKTKISKAVKQLNCNHRLILSGTPIQNNVLDLWSLFDFLVPGFLGTEKQFQARYGKPILASREAKSSSKEQEAGALAMETLHRQVLPFILRRLKEDVLQDLPPKIIQDYYCDLSPLQVQLYEDFARSQAQRGVEDCVNSSKAMEQSKRGSTHVFQALQYLRKVCNHPALVLTPNHPKYEEVTLQLKQQNTSLHDIHHAPKLTALRQLLTDCGIGVADPSSGSGQLASDTPVVNQHRVLLFCQLKSMLDIVERDLLKLHMSSVTYLRLDGGVAAGYRHDIVNRFNNDPSIDLLLLTTHVGGLGLNLTGADTVIFVEHDWNPMKDLQAMDRAHRIGQKKVVNVYRLVTRGTLEEKIMGLQKFKMTIANTVISQDNASLETMGTDQLLDLFTLDDKKKGESSAPGAGQSGEDAKKDTVKSILENLGDLWDEGQYESEYNMDSFMQSLSK